MNVKLIFHTTPNFPAQTHSDRTALLPTRWWSLGRNRLRAAHSFGRRYRLSCQGCRNEVAIAFERRTHSDSHWGRGNRERQLAVLRGVPATESRSIADSAESILHCQAAHGNH